MSTREYVAGPNLGPSQFHVYLGEHPEAGLLIVVDCPDGHSFAICNVGARELAAGLLKAADAFEANRQ